MSIPRIIAVMNHKGGVGKTATVAGLASGLKENDKNCKVLIVDADEQANIKTIFGIKLREADGSLASILMENPDPSKCAITVRDGVDVILSGGRKLRDFNSKFTSMPEAETLMSKRFKDLDGYDYVLIDCPPALSLISSNIAIYADFILIPVAPDMLSLVAAKATVQFLDEIALHYQNVAQILGVLPTQHDPRRNMDIDIIDDLERLEESGFLRGGQCFSEIKMDVKFKTAQVRRKLIHEAFPRSKSANDYTRLAEEVIERLRAIDMPLMAKGAAVATESQPVT